MGIYPFVACDDWRGLAADVDALADTGLVSLTLVTDPFCPLDTDRLRDIFPDRMQSFNDHHVVDLASDYLSAISKRRLRQARAALREMTVETVENPEEVADTWVSLYRTLVERHDIRDMRAFSPEALKRQLQVPGAIVFRAHRQGRTLGMHIWYVHGDTAHSHLTAMDAEGYERRASYALHVYAFEHLPANVRWVNLGGVPGGESNEGLYHFKSGWATETRPTYLCGRILDRAGYEALAESTGTAASDWFPAYREGEFDVQERA
jgi:hypothetical protein